MAGAACRPASGWMVHAGKAPGWWEETCSAHPRPRTASICPCRHRVLPRHRRALPLLLETLLRNGGATLGRQAKFEFRAITTILTGPNHRHLVRKLIPAMWNSSTTSGREDLTTSPWVQESA